MTDESYGFATAKARLEEIVTQVRKKDTSLEKSLDLLEEGVRLANQCTELIDHADWEAAGGTADLPADVAPDAEGPAADSAQVADAGSESSAEASEETGAVT